MVCVVLQESLGVCSAPGVTWQCVRCSSSHLAVCAVPQESLQGRAGDGAVQMNAHTHSLLRLFPLDFPCVF